MLQDSDEIIAGFVIDEEVLSDVKSSSSSYKHGWYHVPYVRPSWPCMGWEEWAKLGDGVWLPKRVHAKIQERIWLDLPNANSSTLREVSDCTYSGYKKFRVKATIVP